MKKKLIVWAILIFNCVATAFSQTADISELTQSIPDSNSYKKSAFSFGFEQRNILGKADRGLNISYEIFVAKNVSLSYSMGLSLQGKGGGFHTTLGLAGLYYGLSNLDKWGKEDESNCSGYYGDDYSDCVQERKGMEYSYLCFLAILPEGINVYIHPGETFSFITYFDLLGFEFRDNQSYISSNLGLKFGIKLSPNTYLEPKVGVRLNLSQSGDSGFIWGISLKSLF